MAPPRRRRSTMSRALASLIAASGGASSTAAAATARATPSCFLGPAAARPVAAASVAATGASASSSSSSTRLFSAPRKSYRRRQADKVDRAAAEACPPTSEGATLDWEKFDYSLSPKLDRRFNDDDDIRQDTGVVLEDLYETEAVEDERDRRRLDQLNEAYRGLDPELVERATAVLLPFVSDARVERIETVLGQRTKRTKFLFENPSNPSNVWACLRTIDSFGVQNVDVVIDSGQFKGKQAVQQKRGMRTAMGSAKWLTLQNHGTTQEAVERVRAEGYKIYASDLNPDSQDVREIDWDDGPICVVMGNEDRGISDEMREAADRTFTLPMCGFAESFNLSVATSITLAHMSANSKDGSGPLRRGDLDPHEIACLRLKGFLGSVQHRTGQVLLKKAGITLPETLRQL